MAYKFNRGCWVESRDFGLMREVEGGPDAGKAQRGSVADPGRSGEEDTSPRMPTVAQKIQLARQLFARWGETLQNHPVIAGLLQRLDQDIAGSQRAMLDLGIMAACARCDATAPEGSCCSRGLEDKYDAILLLINLLCGVGHLEASRAMAGSCTFLGPHGCGLKVRHMLCIDYLCPELETELGAEGLIHMQGVAGREIETAFRLGEAIKKAIMG